MNIIFSIMTVPDNNNNNFNDDNHHRRWKRVNTERRRTSSRHHRLIIPLFLCLFQSNTLHHCDSLILPCPYSSPSISSSPLLEITTDERRRRRRRLVQSSMLLCCNGDDDTCRRPTCGGKRLGMPLYAQKKDNGLDDTERDDDAAAADGDDERKSMNSNSNSNSDNNNKKQKSPPILSQNQNKSSSSSSPSSTPTAKNNNNNNTKNKNKPKPKTKPKGKTTTTTTNKRKNNDDTDKVANTNMKKDTNKNRIKNKTNDKNKSKTKLKNNNETTKSKQSKPKQQNPNPNKKTDDKSNGKIKPKPKPKPKNGTKILSLLSNPYEAGKALRETIDSALTTLSVGVGVGDGTVAGGMSRSTRLYYLDDRFLESSLLSSSSSGKGGDGMEDAPLGALAFAQRSGDNPTTAAVNILLNSVGRLDGDVMMDDGYVPEVLVIGATGEIGRLVVRRLVREGRVRVRVLVRDLYSKTLNLLGTGVTYCQGDLNNLESLEYAVTDVDKIVFCAGAPRSDEDDFRVRFEEFVKENLEDSKVGGGKVGFSSGIDGTDNRDDDNDDDEWQKLSDQVEVRARLAEQVDSIGMQNLVRAYQNVRHADYGTSQAAKRSLFKFQDREGDFALFSIDDSVDDESDDDGSGYGGGGYSDGYGYGESFDTSLYDLDNPITDGDDTSSFSSPYNIRQRTSKTQASWKKNKFEHGVFCGRIPSTSYNPSTTNRSDKTQPLASASSSASSSVVSDRLRSRETPTLGIDLSNGFAGFVCRICGDGKNYEAFLRTTEYKTDGIEYVCKFSTASKPRGGGGGGGYGSGGGNRSGNKFVTVRLPFSNFIPVKIRSSSDTTATTTTMETLQERRLRGRVFGGRDVQQIGFRFCSGDNPIRSTRLTTTGTGIPGERRRGREGDDSAHVNFYLALCYIKVYRSQPEPEFVYLSDARIPPVVHHSMVRHDLRQILCPTTTKPIMMMTDGSASSSSLEEGNGDSATIFDEKEAQRVMANPKDRSGEETYFKFRGEEVLKHSGLSYAIVRIAGLNELPSGEFSTVQLQQSNVDLTPVSRSEVADVCASALLNPNARNVCFYMTKTKPGERSLGIDEKASKQFVNLKETT